MSVVAYTRPVGYKRQWARSSVSVIRVGFPMSKTILALGVSLLMLGAMIWLLQQTDSRPTRTPAQLAANGEIQADSAVEVTLFCAASNRAVMEVIRAEYEELTGRKVAIQYGPSQTLLSQIEVSRVGDLYLPADDSFLELAADKGIVKEVLPIANMHCGLAVRRGNPHGIKKLSDVFAAELRLVQANPEAAAVAKLTKQVTSQQGLWQQLDQATGAYRTTVNDVATDVQLGAADVGIVYDAVLHSYHELEFVPVPELAEAVSTVSIGVIGSSRQPTAALHFARYVAARDRGLLHYQTHGFQTLAGDVWADSPELSVFAGSMLRPVIEETIVAFEQREGVRVSRVYNGCGILVAQMKSGLQPDAYFACDLEFMSQVSDLFPNSVTVSTNELAILVPKGNPKKIQSLRDLTRAGLRVGIGHEKQCAMGWITQMTFSESGLQSEIMENVTVQTPTGDMLVNQLLTGSLDAAVAYLSNAAGAVDELDAFAIDGIPCSTATQPWGVAANSKYPQLADRLFAQISSAESQEVFAAEGFGWELKPKSTSGLHEATTQREPASPSAPRAPAAPLSP
jgi:molybdate transport system substrate-binding protein